MQKALSHNVSCALSQHLVAMGTPHNMLALELNWETDRDTTRRLEELAGKEYELFQIQGDRIQQEHRDRTIKIGKYMEIKTTYRQRHREAILDKPSYKQHHFHDYSVITTDIDVNEEYAKHMIIDIYAQAQKKPRPTSLHRLYDPTPR
eukprot:1480041-Amphidinium_carterae.1